MLEVTAHDARNADRTSAHIDALREIQEQSGRYACRGRVTTHRDCVQATILPYIIQKKKAKLRKSMAEMIPVLGGAAKSAKKAKWGQKGVQRTIHANMLAHHHCHTDCALTAAIALMPARPSAPSSSSPRRPPTS